MWYKLIVIGLVFLLTSCTKKEALVSDWSANAEGTYVGRLLVTQNTNDEGREKEKVYQLDQFQIKLQKDRQSEKSSIIITSPQGVLYLQQVENSPFFEEVIFEKTKACSGSDKYSLVYQEESNSIQLSVESSYSCENTLLLQKEVFDGTRIWK